MKGKFYTMFLLDYPNVKVQYDSGQTNRQAAIVSLVIKNGLVTNSFVKASEWCKKNNPKMIIYDVDNGEEMVYDYLNGYVGEQLKLKLEV